MIIGLAGKSKLKRGGIVKAQRQLDLLACRPVPTRPDPEVLCLPRDHRNFLRSIALAELVLEDVKSVVPEQPYGIEETTRGAEYRAYEVERITGADIAIGIENGVWKTVHHTDPAKCRYIDAAVVVMRYKGESYYATSEGILFPTKYVMEAMAQGAGNEITVGKIIAKHLECDHANPHAALTYGILDREDIMARAVFAGFVQLPYL